MAAGSAQSPGRDAPADEPMSEASIERIATSQVTFFCPWGSVSETLHMTKFEILTCKGIVVYRPNNCHNWLATSHHPRCCTWQ